ncbi:MAG: aminotransferase class I and II [Acidobacteriota bacterium]|nr:aminotransferase class I and II [Acidobacteriota bacterium]
MSEQPQIRTVNVTRYVTPLREGGSLPAIVEADDDGMYVLKFRGAGQGVKALIAELVSGAIARSFGLPIPEIVFVNLDRELSRTEPDPEIQDLLRASAGLNLALDYLPGSITFDPLVETIDARLASEIVWFDCFVMNIDRTPRNTNMLVWHKKLWLIDHGASLYFHHAWQNVEEQATRPFIHVKDHVLLPAASELEDVDARLKSALDGEKVAEIVSLIPEEWLASAPQFETIEQHRQAYRDFLMRRLAASQIFVEEAQRARKMFV